MASVSQANSYSSQNKQGLVWSSFEMTAAGNHPKDYLQSYYVFLSALSVAVGKITNGDNLLWENKTGEAYIDGGFRYDNGTLMVPRKGLYRVFLQTLFEIDTCHCVDGFLSLSSLVKIFRQGYETETSLLTAADSVACNDHKGDVENLKKSLFTSGIFKLDTNDKLSATSSHPDCMAKNEHMSFFGAQLVFDDWSDS
uniref:THD domain-containing protein n=1 Tax=Poecilia reticulata TaxID=8081 RepID=A0A3P9PDZ6_POERE